MERKEEGSEGRREWEEKEREWIGGEICRREVEKNERKEREQEVGECANIILYNYAYLIV